MKRFLFICISVFFLITLAQAQKIYGTRNGKITFSSPTDEDVKAVNNEVSSRIADNGQITFSLLIKGFKFKYAEMQDHFNDQYLNSTLFPRADFKGMMVNIKEVDFTKDGSYKVSVKGDLNLHGVSKNITTNGTIEIKSGKPTVSCKFVMLMKDFNVDASSVTEKVTLEISCQYQ